MAGNWTGLPLCDTLFCAAVLLSWGLVAASQLLFVAHLLLAQAWVHLVVLLSVAILVRCALLFPLVLEP